MVSLAGIVLAGGRSSRMGSDKGLLPLPGSDAVTFVEHLTLVLAAICREMVLVTRNEAQAIDYARRELPAVRIVTDQIPDIGPLMGLYTGLSTIHATHALVTAVDTPFLQPTLLSFLLSQSLDDSLLVPRIAGIPQVLLAIYPRSILPALEARLREGRRDPRSLLQVAPVHYLEEAQLRAVDPQLRSFVNVNTPDELASLYC